MALSRSLAVLFAIASSGCLIDWDRYEAASGGGDTGASDPGGGPQGGMNNVGGGGAETGASGPGGGGDGPGGGGSEPGECGTTGILSDDFEDGSSEGLYWSSQAPGATIEEAGDFSVTPATMQQGWSAYGTQLMYDLTGSEVWIEVTEMLDTSTGAEAFLTITTGGDDYIAIGQRGGSFRASRTIDDAWMQLGSEPYDPVAHRFWKIRETAGTVYWEYSSDGADWQSLASAPVATLFPLDSMLIQFGALTFGDETTPGTVRFDNLNGGTPSSVPFCPMETLVDDFEDPARARVWSESYESAHCSLDETDGELQISLDGEEGVDCGYVSSKAFDLSESSFAVEVVELPTDVPSHYAFFRSEIDWRDGFDIVLVDTELRFESEVDSTTSIHAVVVYDPEVHRYWRIRGEGGDVVWETSPDGSDWTVHHRRAAPFPLSKLRAVLGAGNGETEPNAGVARFDNLNVGP